MKTILVLFVVLTIHFEIDIIQINCVKQTSLVRGLEKDLLLSRQMNKLRKFSMFGLNEMRKIKDIIKADEMHQKIQIEKERQEIERKNAERQKIYEKHLLKFQGGSNVLRDFNTNRF